MIATARPHRPRLIRRRDLERFRQSIESWERQGNEARREGDVELAAGYAEDVADLRAILRLIESGELDDAAEVHHRHARTNMAHDRQVVGDEEVCQGEALFELAASKTRPSRLVPSSTARSSP